MAHVNLLKQIKIDDRWVLRSIPKKSNGQRDWSALPDGSYFIEWREKGRRRRLPAGATVAQALEVQRRKRHELEGRKVVLMRTCFTGRSAGGTLRRNARQRFVIESRTDAATHSS